MWQVDATSIVASPPQTKPPDISVASSGINMDKPSVTQFKARRSLRSQKPPSSYDSSSAGSSSSQTSTTTMNYPPFDSLSGVRKRTLSSTFNDDDPIYGGGNKRLRRDSSFAGSASFDVSMASISSASMSTITSDLRRFPRSQGLRRTSSASFLSSRSSSRSVTPAYYEAEDRFTMPARISSPFLGLDPPSRAATPVVSAYTTNYIYSAISAKHFFRETRTTIDYTPPDPPTEGPITSPPMLWSADNLLFFPRGSRMHYKNMSAAEDSEVFQLCRLQEKSGQFTALECRPDVPNMLAVGTSGGTVQLWDISTKTKTLQFSTKGVTAMSWNGAILSVGNKKGGIRHFDTRINPSTKMKEQAKRVTRHQAYISTLAWNVDGRLLASGDSNGTVYCWDARGRTPLDTGEFVQRRKKIQHDGPITALTWCPWKPKLLVTGDSSSKGKNLIRLWDVSLPPPGSNPLVTHPDPVCNAAKPGRIEMDAQITGLYFSIECQELLSTHGPGSDEVIARTSGVQADRPMPRGLTGNTISVHSLPMLRHIITEPIAIGIKGVSGGCLNPTGMKMAFSLPSEKKIKVYDVWGKRKEIKKTPSFAKLIR
ncbi:hypothetical protein PC9H_011501 [Pleurotus ostreatus]|uniref:Uncharacterized protein n=2 Tax=Pleurotus ostreatus TaxID=5322 RepID=A0A067N7B8_PLEO1|nr:uncharacterized protein PC9H_011501 [Pleurotus ostreatus]KAF7420982.1 hypothetical protein PC9H_011501 [Pleurotus ostreatus]KDQ23908.1 hypothetical protein PLEOSDRAFT_162098 [Pleurotus ostreatus PC15]